PNFNLIVRPSDKLTFRFAAAEVTARPDLSSTGVGVGLQPVSMTGSAGNPDLKPYAATQFDLTGEWYFAPASMFSVSLFKKNVAAFTRIVQFTELHPEAPNNTLTGPASYTYLVSRPENGTDGKIDGIEVNYQHSLTFLPAPFDGLGFSVAYTYAKSTTPNVDALTGKRLPIPNASKNSLSAVAYYEKGPFSARVAYTYRSSYLVQQQAASAGGSLYADGRGQLDASASFKLNENFRLTIDAVNLGRDINSFYVNDRTRLFSSFQNDRRIYVGAAATF
ncbi:MAG: TonB-dependent receptor, partial [Alphaproteobacteria bacterium]